MRPIKNRALFMVIIFAWGLSSLWLVAAEESSVEADSLAALEPALREAETAFAASFAEGDRVAFHPLLALTSLLEGVYFGLVHPARSTVPSLR